MQRIPMRLVRQAECNEVYADRDTVALPTGVNDETQLCAGSGAGERDACRVSQSDKLLLPFYLII